MSSEVEHVAEANVPANVPAPNRQPARASVRMSIGNSTFQADAEITPFGLLAIGGMVGAILLAVAPIVAAAGKARRRR